MIWLIGVSFTLVIGLYLTAPFLARQVDTSETAEIAAYKEELRLLERSEEPTKAKTAILQARLLKAARAEKPIIRTRSAAIAGGITLGLLFGTTGLYAALGSPNFEPEVVQAPPPMSPENDFASLLPQFEARLAENPQDTKGWYLYGRTLMLAGDPEAGLRAYRRAIELSDDPAILREYEAAKTFAEQALKGPAPEDIAAMQSLPKADQMAAIKGMVESLRAKLDETPNDPEGWVRLLRSRNVLGQDPADDIAALKQALPEQADQIIREAGETN